MPKRTVESCWTDDTRALFRRDYQDASLSNDDLAADYDLSSNSLVSKVGYRLGLGRRPEHVGTGRRRSGRLSWQSRERRCITCPATFKSEHYGHRMCDDCRAVCSLDNQMAYA